MYYRTPVRKFSKYFLGFAKAFRSSLIGFIVITGNSLMLICAAAFYHFEKGQNSKVDDFFSAIWWAFSTVTTVGYGDITPVTIAGKLTAIVLMVVGASFFVGFTAILVSNLMSETTEKILDTEQITAAEYKIVMDELRYVRDKLEKIDIKLNSK